MPTKTTTKRNYAVSPDYAVAPGGTLAETLTAKQMSQSDLSLRSGLAEKTISQIINGVAPISYDTALKLETVLGVPARFHEAPRSALEPWTCLAIEGRDWSADSCVSAGRWFVACSRHVAAMQTRLWQGQSSGGRPGRDPTRSLEGYQQREVCC